MATLEIDYQPDLDSDHCIAYITLEPKSIDKDATLQVIGEINVKDSRPVNNSRVLFKKSFRTTSAQMEVELPARFDRVYSYAGKKIDVIIKVRLIVDDALIFDSQTKDIMPEQALQKPTITRTGKELADPKDAVSLPRSFGAISPTDQVKAAALLMAGLVVIGVLMTAGWNRLAGQGAFGAFLGAVAGSVATGAGVWYLLRKLLARYVTFALHPNLHIEKDRFYTVGELVHGQARIPLSNARLRVVGYNLEKGQYRRGWANNLRTVSFGNPANGVLLYDETVDHIPAHTQIADSFPGHLMFDDMCPPLYPPLLYGKNHGLAVQWEVQLILDDLLDQEVIGDIGSLRYEDFLDGRPTPQRATSPPHVSALYQVPLAVF